MCSTSLGSRNAFASSPLSSSLGRRRLVVSNAAKVTGKIKLALTAGKVRQRPKGLPQGPKYHRTQPHHLWPALLPCRRTQHLLLAQRWAQRQEWPPQPLSLAMQMQCLLLQWLCQQCSTCIPSAHHGVCRDVIRMAWTHAGCQHHGVLQGVQCSHRQDGGRDHPSGDHSV